ncbi:MAG: hypothetical protein PF542_02615 [Nanoarchaeota archaeon]|jgi:hypothetical protein|nr:hypothetical protein [Nanoarchaeota archaeon]
MKDLAKILLKNGDVHLWRERSASLPPEEREALFKRASATILEGNICKVIAIRLYHEVCPTDKEGKPIKKEMDCYEAEDVYRIPYTENKELLNNMLNLAKKTIHSYNANRV